LIHARDGRSSLTPAATAYPTGAFGCLHMANHVPGMQPDSVWLPGLAPGSGGARARFPSGPGYRKRHNRPFFLGLARSVRRLVR
jgi:hypothetical protein